MTNILVQFWEWLRGRKRSNPAAWRYAMEHNAKAATPANTDPSNTAPANTEAPAQPEPALPLGSRYRRQASEYSMTMGQEEELNRLLQSIRPLPQGAITVMRELDSANASAASVGQALECEPVMAAAVVRIANSTAMGLRREITSMSEAVAYLGFSTTKSLLLRFNIQGLLPSSKPGQGYDSGKLWVHAMAVAQVAEEVARRAGQTDPNLALTAGLLHDIGKLAINSRYPNVLDQLFSPDADPDEGLLNRERRLFKADHAMIGGTLGREWKLPQELIEIIQLHHMPQSQLTELKPETRRALYVVQIANQLVKYRHVYCDGMEIDEVPAAMTSELGLPDWAALLADGRLCSMIDRVIQLNGGTTEPAAAAA